MIRKSIKRDLQCQFKICYKSKKMLQRVKRLIGFVFIFFSPNAMHHRPYNPRSWKMNNNETQLFFCVFCIPNSNTTESEIGGRINIKRPVRAYHPTSRQRNASSTVAHTHTRTVAMNEQTDTHKYWTLKQRSSQQTLRAAFR